MAAHFVPEPKMHLPDGLLDPRVELTTRQVADLTCAGKDTIQRRLNSKAFPHARRREGGVMQTFTAITGRMAQACRDALAKELGITDRVWLVREHRCGGDRRFSKENQP